ncbi:hypothetical protein DY000_02010406 [Brassica cretica]|uniref:RING-type E3 ubiquitin transferase n=1 Tax=Brassica cretica TaxID=69181 RepID=A0ABQ7C1X9_BRACR|nr:hypothetical protein DY000_02010406 [Brassica cretica]
MDQSHESLWKHLNESNPMDLTVFLVIMLIVCYYCGRNDVGLPLEPIHQTPQQDIETGQQLPLPKVILFKDIKVEEGGGGGCGKSSCPICLEEYDDDHEIRRLNKCGHVFHRFSIDSWLTNDPRRTCLNCRGSQLRNIHKPRKLVASGQYELKNACQEMHSSCLTWKSHSQSGKESVNFSNNGKITANICG